MGFIFTGAFWGIFLILIGISVLIKVFFNVDFPVFRIFFGLFFILIGLNIIMGWKASSARGGSIVFGEGEFSASGEDGKYTVIFGKGVTDLSTGSIPLDKKIEVNTIFGENVIYLPKGKAVSIRANAAFGQIDFPDGNSAAFGSYNYKSPEYKAEKPYVKIEMNTVFGATKVRFRD